MYNAAENKRRACFPKLRGRNLNRIKLRWKEKEPKGKYTRGNGYYVTVSHNSTYSTQYLHMNKRGLRVGTRVKQGDKIGEVGITGYTSGPHVCYRFWKNGKQVDPLKQKLPEAKPISNELKEIYLSYMNPIKNELDNIESSLTFEQNNLTQNNVR